MFKRLLNLGALSLFLILGLSFGERIHVVADKFRGERGKLIYIGNVKLTTDKGKKLLCDRLEVYLGKDNKISKAVAIGHVVYTDPNYRATCHEAIYKPEQDVVILKGNAVVTNKKGFIKGDEIVYNLKTGNINVQSTKGVTSVFEVQESK